MWYPPFLVWKCAATRQLEDISLWDGSQPAEEFVCFAPDSLRRHKFFNTNNLWVNLRKLKATLDASGGWRGRAGE